MYAYIAVSYLMIEESIMISYTFIYIMNICIYTVQKTGPSLLTVVFHHNECLPVGDQCSVSQPVHKLL